MPYHPSHSSSPAPRRTSAQILLLTLESATFFNYFIFHFFVNKFSRFNYCLTHALNCT